MTAPVPLFEILGVDTSTPKRKPAKVLPSLTRGPEWINKERCTRRRRAKVHFIGISMSQCICRSERHMSEGVVAMGIGNLPKVAMEFQGTATLPSSAYPVVQLLLFEVSALYQRVSQGVVQRATSEKSLGGIGIGMTPKLMFPRATDAARIPRISRGLPMSLSRQRVLTTDTRLVWCVCCRRDEGRRTWRRWRSVAYAIWPGCECRLDSGQYDSMCFMGLCTHKSLLHERSCESWGKRSTSRLMQY